MSVADLYRNRGVNPLAVQGGLMRLPLDANTVNLWNFDEKSGVKLRDLGSDMSGGAVATGMTWAAGGPFGSSLNMDAALDANGIVVANVSAVTGSQTMEFIFRPRTGCPTSMLYVYGSGYAAMALDAYWVAGTMSFRCRKDSTTGVLEIASSSVFNVEVWHYVAQVFTAESTLKVYTDGVETASGDTSAYSALLSQTSFFFGRRNADGNSPGLWEFATIRHSKIARSAAEILANAKCMGFA